MGWQGHPQRPQPIPRGELETMNEDTEKKKWHDKPAEPPPLYAKILGGIILAILVAGIALPLMYLFGKGVAWVIISLWEAALS